MSLLEFSLFAGAGYLLLFFAFQVYLASSMLVSGHWRKVDVGTVLPILSFVLLVLGYWRITS